MATNDRPSAVLAQWTNPHAEWARQLRSTIGPVELITDLQPEGLHETCFDEIHSLPTVASTHDALPAEDIVETQFGQLIAAALERVAINRPWGAIWLHSRFLTRCWDAPRDLSLLEEDRNEGPDQEQDGQDESMENKTESSALEMDGEMLMPPLSLFESTQPPQIELSEQGHPDLVTAWMNTYGSQVRLVDLLLDILLQTIEAESPAVMLVGTSGFRLGQGGHVGHRSGPLRSPDIRLPLIVNRGGPLHVPQLTASPKVTSVLSVLSDPGGSLCPPDTWSVSSKETLPIEIDSDRARVAVSNADWFYVQDADLSEHLFLKPDDSEDFNDIGRLRADVIEMLRPETKNGLSDP